MKFTLRSSSFFLPFSSGIILGLIFFKLIHPSFLFIALVPFLLFLYHEQNKRRLWTGGFLLGFVYLLFNLFPLVFLQWQGFYNPQRLFLVEAYLFFCLLGGFLLGAVVLLMAFIKTRTRWDFIILPVMWAVLFEWVYARIAYGFTWSYLGYLAVDVDFFREFSAIGGALGAGALIVFFNIGFLFLLKERKNFNKFKYTALIIVLGFGITAISTKYVHSNFKYSEPISVSVAQANTRESISSFKTEPYATLLKEAISQKPDLIVLPEAILNTDSFVNNTSQKVIGDLITQEAGGFIGKIAFGAFRWSNGNLYNSFYLWEKGGITAVYDKQKLVPFAEYRPQIASSIAPQSKTKYVHGTEANSFVIAEPSFGVAICQEAMYPNIFREQTKNGASLLISGANDGSVQASSILHFLTGRSELLSRQEHIFARFRAAENGRYLLRSTKYGVASIIDNFGKEVKVVEPGKTAILEGRVAPVQGETPFVRFGDTPLLILALGILAVRARKIRRILK